MQVITPVTHDLGDFKVQPRASGARADDGRALHLRRRVRPRALPAGQGMDVRPHPHINLATVTYLFEGAIEHRDSIGSHAVIEPGAINLMTAGSGIVHSERSPLALRPTGQAFTECRPGSRFRTAGEDIEPAFDHVPEDRLPMIEDGGVHARVLMGNLVGRDRGDALRFPDDLRRHRDHRRLDTRSKRRPTSGASCWSAARPSSTADVSSPSRSMSFAPATKRDCRAQAADGSC